MIYIYIYIYILSFDVWGLGFRGSGGPVLEDLGVVFELARLLV